MTFDIGMSIHVSLKTNQQCNKEYWDKALTASPRRQYPLAPRGIAMDLKFYNCSNKSLTKFVTEIMSKELISLSNLTYSENPRHIEILGVGLLRDLQWTIGAVRDGFSIGATDCSAVACKNINSFIERNELVNFNAVRELDAEEALFGFAGAGAEVSASDTSFFYAGQFIQNQPPRMKDRFMRYFGSFLKIPNFGGPRRRIYLLHPLGEHNPPCEVKWRKSRPYRLEELIKPLEKGYEASVSVTTLGVHKYCGHQTYSLLRFEGGE